VAGYRIVKIYPHDRGAFTQGLVFHDGTLYEGTGMNGESAIRQVNLENGAVLRQRKIDARYFGEGIAIWKNRLIQLTWQAKLGFVYDLATFEQQRTFSYTGEGWGLTQDGTHLIMSDGTSTLRFLDPETLRPVRTLQVKDGNRPVEELNELEVVNGEILANVWRTERIARISPASGQVTGWIDLTGLLDPRDRPGTDVMNGIAWDAAGKRLFVTGKRWPKLFEIAIVPPEGRRHDPVPEGGRSPFRSRAGATCSSPSFAAMSSADVAGLTALSIARILPSLPM
jgi:glutaminyl-peptide cyclotransferase